MKSTSKTGNKRSNTTIKSLQPSKKQQTITSGQQKLNSFFKTKQQNQVQKNGSINATRDNSNVIVDNSIVYSPSSSLLHNTVESESIQQSDIDIKAIKNTLAEKTSTIDHSTTKNKANEPLSIGSVATFSDTSITMIDKNNNKNDYKYSLVYKSTESDSQVSHNLLNTQEESIDSNNNKDNNASTFFDNSMYTEQFNHMIDTVLDGESFLFTKNNLNRFKIFKQLIKESQHLIVRLWMRNRRWIRMSKLDYSTTISDIYQASKELSKCGLIYIDDENNDSDNNNNILTWDTMMNLINMDEIKELTRLYNCELLTGKTKSDYIIALTKSYQQSKQLRSNILHNKQKDPYIQKIKQILGPCIIMDSDYYALFQRLNIVYYRLRDPTETNSMKAAILSKISKRHYPDYIYNRTENIWKSIEDLDQYETAFYLQRDFEMKMESIILERRIRNRKNQDKKNNNISNDDNNDDDDFNEHNDRQLWMDCWIICENIVGLWEELVQKRPLSMDIDRPYFMRRFEAGWIYTHMIEHGTKALSRLQEYSLEAVILQKLIDQEIYRLGKRGKWYERLALIQSKYLKDIPERTRKKMALQTCINGIQDPKVHQIYINSLQKRIQRLERDLCIPKREQHDFSYLTLKKPSEKIIYGEKLSDSTGKKSIWRADDGATISVEEVAIQYYNKTGYQGLHTENGVVTMLVKNNKRLYISFYISIRNNVVLIIHLLYYYYFY
ncbi:unnamed protein product [Cunninghamella blakesleeana]